MELTLERIEQRAGAQSYLYPLDLPLVWIIDGIWCVLFSRMRFRIAGEAIMTSIAGTRPGAPARGNNCWAITA